MAAIATEREKQISYIAKFKEEFFESLANDVKAKIVKNPDAGVNPVVVATLRDLARSTK